MTVSRALRQTSDAPRRVSEQTHRKVLSVARSMNYRIHPAARALSCGRSLNIGFHINCPGFRWDSPSWSNVIFPMQRCLWKQGYQLGFYHFLPEDIAEFGDFLSSHRFVDGIVTLGRNLSLREAAVIRESGLRAVSLYERLDGCVALLIDERAAGRAAADYLWARGHRRVGILAQNVRLKRWCGRWTGFLERAAQIGLEVPEKDRLFVGPEDVQGSERRIARELFRQWRRSGSAVRCFWIPSDYLAFGVVEELDERGLQLGRDFSVLSYDNFEGMGYAPWRKPRLSSFEPPLAEIGQKAAALLTAEAGGDGTDCLVFHARLVDRGSVATQCSVH